MTLAYAAGWIIVPGALLGLWLALRPAAVARGARVRRRRARSLGASSLEAGLLQASLPLGKEIQERYVFYAVPLLGLCFALYARRGWPLRLPHLALAAALVLVSVRAAAERLRGRVDRSNGSPILFGVYWLTGKLGKPGDGLCGRRRRRRR